MRGFAILAAWLTVGGWAFPVVPLVSEPHHPAYMQFVPTLLSQAQEEILAALSDLRRYPEEGPTAVLVEALAQAAARGLTVRVLVERSSSDLLFEQREALRFLASYGVDVREDTPEVTLHTKFLVVDRRWVVVGSTHWTYTALTESVQVDLAIDCPELAGLLAQFFHLVWEGDLQARVKLESADVFPPAVLPLLDLPSGSLHATWVPQLIGRAERSVDICLYSFSYYPQYPDSPSNRIVDALRAALARGVQVRLLLDDGALFPDLAQANRLTGALLASYGAQVRLDSAEAVLHAKCLLVDGRDVLVSSANWVYSSLARNVEAGVVFLGVPELAQALQSKFDELWRRAHPVR